MKNFKIHFIQNLNPNNAVKFEESAIISAMSSNSYIDVVLDNGHTIDEISRLVYQVIEKRAIREGERYNCAFQDVVWGESDGNSGQTAIEVTYYLTKIED